MNPKRRAVGSIYQGGMEWDRNWAIGSGSGSSGEYFCCLAVSSYLLLILIMDIA